MCCRASCRRLAMAVAESLEKKMVGSSLGSEKARRQSLGVPALVDLKRDLFDVTFSTTVL